MSALKKIGYKIREAQLSKSPYMLIVGQKEEEDKAVSVRSRIEGDKGSMSQDDLLHRFARKSKNVL